MSKHRADRSGEKTIPMALMELISKLETVPMFVIRHDHAGPCDPLCPVWDMEIE